jgi:hypothetical membrane protein
MKMNRVIVLLTANYILLLLVMFILPLFTAPGYSISRDTLGELGAQFTPHAWIMNFVFVSLSLCSVIAGWRYFEGSFIHRIVLVLFGISLALSAFFNHAPLNHEIKYNIIEDGWNIYFTGTASLSFIILSIATSLILEKQHDRLLAIAAGISAIIISILTTEADQYAGIWQRLMFIISFGWMIYIFRSGEL